MGCASSKTAGPKTKLPQHFSRRESSASKDSGIGLTCSKEERRSVSDEELVEKQQTKKAIAFEIGINKDGSIKQHPPRKNQNRLNSPSSRNSEPNSLPPLSQKSPGRKRRHHDVHRITAEEIEERQAEAERKREIDRLATIARQRRRELRAQKVTERRKCDHWSENTDEELSDADQTFNIDDEDEW
ncbi:unnamed protein product [Clavelina lepadiformis]|uniref:Uncharacterized protein n=1 Tax=Clavelina lepadiformis TaxID=159417 RepID=A0ABP0F2H4_CLALP